MLVLTRKVGERVMIGDNITLTITEIKGDNVRIALDAPREVKIYRGEIFDSIIEENQKAAAPASLPGMEILKNLYKK